MFPLVLGTRAVLVEVGAGLRPDTGARLRPDVVHPPPPPVTDPSQGKRPQRWPQKRLDSRLEEVVKAVGGGYCWLQMSLKLVLAVRGIVAGRRLDAREGGGRGVPPPLPMHPCPRPPTRGRAPAIAKRLDSPAGSANGTIDIWDLDTGALLRTLRGHTGRVAAVAAAAVPQWLVSGGEDGAVRQWNASTGDALHAAPEAHPAGVGCVAVAPGAAAVVTGGADGAVAVWDARSWGRPGVVETGAAVDAVAVSRAPPDSDASGTTIVVVGGGAGPGAGAGAARFPVSVWDAGSGALRQALSGHSAPVRALAVSSDGTRIVSAAADGGVRRWLWRDTDPEAPVSTEDPSAASVEPPGPASTGDATRYPWRQLLRSGLCAAPLVRGGGGLGWVGLGQGLAWSPTHGPRRLPCGTRLGGRTRVSGHKAYRTVDRPQTPRWRSRAGDAAVPVCMCPCVSEGGGGGCGTPACSIVVRRWRTWRGEVCAWCSRPRQGGWRA